MRGATYRWRTGYGRTLVGGRGEMKTTILQRLFDRIEVTEECWTWTGPRTGKGYGKAYSHPATRSVHRLLYEIVVGAVPDGFELDHLCRNRACARWDHLEPVTHRENLRRSPLTMPSINAAKTHCPKGHEYDAQHSRGERACRTCNRLRMRVKRASLDESKEG